MTCDTWRVVSKSIKYPPPKYKTILLVSKFSIISKITKFLFKSYLHCNLPNFRNVSNTSAQPSPPSPLSSPCSIHCPAASRDLDPLHQRGAREIQRTLNMQLIIFTSKIRTPLTIPPPPPLLFLFGNFHDTPPCVLLPFDSF